MHFCFKFNKYFYLEKKGESIDLIKINSLQIYKIKFNLYVLYFT